VTYYRYEELTASQFAEALHEKSLVYVPVGSIEFHGPHLPLGMDTIHAYAFCVRVAQETGGIVLPPTYWGAIGHHDWPGSALISAETFRAWLKDVFRSLGQQGVKLIVASTGHHPEVQGKAIAEVAQESMTAYPLSQFLALDPFSTHPTDPTADHAGKKETSLMLAIRPDLVHMETLVGEEAFNGIWPDCVEGTAAFGAAYLGASVTHCAAIVQKAWDELQG